MTVCGIDACIPWFARGRTERLADVRRKQQVRKPVPIAPHGNAGTHAARDRQPPYGHVTNGSEAQRNSNSARDLPRYRNAIFRNRNRGTSSRAGSEACSRHRASVSPAYNDSHAPLLWHENRNVPADLSAPSAKRTDLMTAKQSPINGLRQFEVPVPSWRTEFYRYVVLLVRRSTCSMGPRTQKSYSMSYAQAFCSTQ